jgi:hypothetical protein
LFPVFEFCLPICGLPISLNISYQKTIRSRQSDNKIVSLSLPGLLLLFILSMISNYIGCPLRRSDTSKQFFFVDVHHLFPIFSFLDIPPFSQIKLLLKHCQRGRLQSHRCHICCSWVSIRHLPPDYGDGYHRTSCKDHRWRGLAF